MLPLLSVCLAVKGCGGCRAGEGLEYCRKPELLLIFSEVQEASPGDEMVWGDAGSPCWETVLPALDTAKGKKISPLRSSASRVILPLQMYPQDSPTGFEIPESLLLVLQVAVMARSWGVLEVTEDFLLF